MSHRTPTSFVPDDHVAAALAEVHGRLRRRRDRIRCAAVSALALVLVLGVAVAAQDRGPDVEAPFAMEDLEATETSTGPTCGQTPESAEQFDLEVTIQRPVEWPMRSDLPEKAGQVTVVARNLGTSTLSVAVPADVVALTEDGLVDTEPAAPPPETTLTLEPSEVVEMPAPLPGTSCAGDVLDGGRYTLVPIITVEDANDAAVVVRGAPLTVDRS